MSGGPVFIDGPVILAGRSVTSDGLRARLLLGARQDGGAMFGGRDLAR
jgi:hypothetical protein